MIIQQTILNMNGLNHVAHALALAQRDLIAKNGYSSERSIVHIVSEFEQVIEPYLSNLSVGVQSFINEQFDSITSNFVAMLAIHHQLVMLQPPIAAIGAASPGSDSPSRVQERDALIKEMLASIMLVVMACDHYSLVAEQQDNHVFVSLIANEKWQDALVIGTKDEYYALNAMKARIVINAVDRIVRYRIAAIIADIESELRAPLRKKYTFTPCVQLDMPIRLNSFQVHVRVFEIDSVGFRSKTCFYHESPVPELRILNELSLIDLLEQLLSAPTGEKYLGYQLVRDLMHSVSSIAQDLRIAITEQAVRTVAVDPYRIEEDLRILQRCASEAHR